MDKRLRLMPNCLQFLDFSSYLHEEILGNDYIKNAGIAVIVPPKGVWSSTSKSALEQSFKIDKVQTYSRRKIANGIYLQYLESCTEFQLTPRKFFEESKNITQENKFNQSDLNNPNVDVSLQEILDFENAIYEGSIPETQLYAYAHNQTLFSSGQITWNLWNIVDNNRIKFWTTEKCERIKGISIPALLFATEKSTIPLHTENGNLAAINFLHWGEPEIWIAISWQYCNKVIRLIRKLYKNCGDDRSDCPNFTAHKVCFISPKILDAHNIPYKRVCPNYSIYN